MSLAWQHHEPASHKRLATLSAALLTVLLLLIATRASAALFAVTVNVGPPALPVYEQPPIPAPGYLWTPGYWAYGPDGYFWVPGTWVEPPAPALVWTPGYWGWANGVYVWNEGYWGPQVGYYGGISYGYGYPGSGFFGGYWQNNQFYYNRSVTNVTTTNITNVYQDRGEQRNGQHRELQRRPGRCAGTADERGAGPGAAATPGSDRGPDAAGQRGPIQP